MFLFISYSMEEVKWMNPLCLLFLSTMCSLLLLGRQADSSDVVVTKSGAVRGFKMTSRSGRSYSAFTKIPYAKPPVAHLRFKGPEPNVEWNGILEANEDLPDCCQLPVYTPTVEKVALGTEDCLYLSVFTPRVGEDNNYPVMIYIHGGGWRAEFPVFGTHNKSQYLLDEDVVLVLFHYRLGALGLLSTEDSVVPGNMGLKDQVEVIRWVKNNIKGFGGDPNKITLFGNSAGGASVHYHLISPLSKDLIQGGISQSGFATSIWALAVPGVALDRAKTLARYLNCPDKPSEELVSCLRTKSAHDITNAENIFISRDFDPAVAYQPVLESGPDAFITDSPYNLKVTKPWIVGIAAQDGAFKVPGYLLDSSLMDSFLRDGPDVLPVAFSFENTTDKPQQIAARIIEHYGTDQRSPQNFTKMWTDGYFTYGLEKAMSVSDGQGYLYILEYRAKALSLDLLAKALAVDFGDLGTSHTDELRSLFNFEDQLPDPNLMSEEDRAFSKRLVGIWSDFAKYGYPKSAEKWRLFGKERNFLRLDKQDKAETNWWNSRVEFLRELPIRNLMEKINL